MNTTIVVVPYLLSILFMFVFLLWKETRNATPITDKDINVMCMLSVVWPFYLAFKLGKRIGALFVIIVDLLIVRNFDKLKSYINNVKSNIVSNSSKSVVLHIRRNTLSGKTDTCETSVDSNGDTHIILSIVGNWIDYDRHLTRFRGYTFDCIKIEHKLKFSQVEWESLRFLVKDKDEKHINIV